MIVLAASVLTVVCCATCDSAQAAPAPPTRVDCAAIIDSFDEVPEVLAATFLDAVSFPTYVLDAGGRRGNEGTDREGLTFSVVGLRCCGGRSLGRRPWRGRCATIRQCARSITADVAHRAPSSCRQISDRQPQPFGSALPSTRYRPVRRSETSTNALRATLVPAPRNLRCVAAAERELLACQRVKSHSRL